MATKRRSSEGHGGLIEGFFDSFNEARSAKRESEYKSREAQEKFKAELTKAVLLKKMEQQSQQSQEVSKDPMNAFLKRRFISENAPGVVSNIAENTEIQPDQDPGNPGGFTVKQPVSNVSQVGFDPNTNRYAQTPV